MISLVIILALFSAIIIMMYGTPTLMIYVPFLYNIYVISYPAHAIFLVVGIIGLIRNWKPYKKLALAFIFPIILGLGYISPYILKIFYVS